LTKRLAHGVERVLGLLDGGCSPLTTARLSISSQITRHVAVDDHGQRSVELFAAAIANGAAGPARRGVGELDEDRAAVRQEELRFFAKEQ
jgi:hypothetical protein